MLLGWSSRRNTVSLSRLSPAAKSQVALVRLQAGCRVLGTSLPCLQRQHCSLLLCLSRISVTPRRPEADLTLLVFAEGLQNLSSPLFQRVPSCSFASASPQRRLPPKDTSLRGKSTAASCGVLCRTHGVRVQWGLIESSDTPGAASQSSGPTSGSELCDRRLVVT